MNTKMQLRFKSGTIAYHNSITHLANLTVRQLTKKMIVICYQDGVEYRFNVSELSTY